MDKNVINVLYVDDEPAYLTAFRASFRRKFNVFTAETVEEARRILDGEEVHVILSDSRMPSQNGVDFFESIRQTHPQPMRMLITGYRNISDVVEAINRAEVYQYFLKPWNEEEMEKVIERAFQLFLKKNAERRLIKHLQEDNSMLEFFVRQKFLS